MKHFLFFILAFAFSSHSQQIDIKSIDSIVSSKIKTNDPALFVGIVKNGDIVYESYQGLANLQHQVQADSLTRSNIASTAKQFTALCVLKLSQENKLSLEDDIRKYLPDLYPKVKDNIKIRHLLNHTSGIRDFYDLMSIQQKPWWRQVGLSNDDAIKLIEKQQDLAFPPGSKYTYSNSGYILLTKIISEVSGMSFHDYSNALFKSFGMHNTSFLKNYMYVIPNQALPYSDWGDGIWQQYPMLTNLYGDGFLFTTLKDQLIYEKAVQNAYINNNVLLLQSQKAIPNSDIKTYGFGLELEQRLNRNAVHHSGSTGSYHSQTLRFPEEKLSVFVMSSNSRIWSGFIADEIANAILPKLETQNVYDTSIKNIQEETRLDQIIGQYQSPSGTIIRIESKDGLLVWKMDNNNPIQLRQEEGNLYNINSNPSTKISFYSSSDDSKLVVFWPNSETKTYMKINDFNPSISDLETYEGTYHSEELELSFTIKLNDEASLEAQISDRKRPLNVEVINKNDLLASDYRMKVERDVFDRVVGIMLTTNRALNVRFTKKTDLKFHPKIAVGNEAIQVSTISSQDGKSSQILLTKNDKKGNEIWFKRYGGKSYDKANSIVAVDDGYLIIGATSSFGNGNYDMYVIKVDTSGEELWSKTYGKFYNDYGYSAEVVENGFLIKGTTQDCSSNSDVFNRTCTTNVWFVTIDNNGNEISNQILEEISDL